MLILIAALGVLGVSASGPIMSVTAAPPLAIAFWRNLIGGGIMAAPTLVTQPGKFTRLGRREFSYVLLAGLSLALHFACFITSVKMTSVSIATALVCLQPAWIAAIERLQGVKLPVASVVGLSAALAGVAAITGVDFGHGSRALIGDVLAFVGGGFAAVYSIAGSKARRSMSTGVYTGLCYGICAAGTLVLAVVTGNSVLGFPPVGWIGILGVTLAAQLMGHTMFNFLLQHWTALRVSMVILLEIPGTAIIAATLLGERLPGGIYAGLGLILAGLFIVVRGQRVTIRRRNKPAVTPEAGVLPDDDGLRNGN